jgi:hypothetical protein
VGDQAEQNRRLVTAAEAAEILGIEQRSVRRRINDGKLEGEKGPDGRTWLVWIDESDIPGPIRARLDREPVARPDPGDADQPEQRSLALLPDDNREAVWALHDIIEDLQGKLLKTTAELERERVLREIAEAKLNALPAGDPIPMPAPAPAQPAPEPEPPKPRTWWQKLLGTG